MFIAIMFAITNMHVVCSSNNNVKQKQPWGCKKRALPSKVGSIEQVNDI